jgi:YHS domain-containing protein
MLNIIKKIAIVSILVLPVSCFMLSQEKDDVIYSTSMGAIDGYDPVAYFNMGKAMKGNEDYSYIWNDAVWYFSSTENRDVFMKNPDKYAPEYGGYCAYAIAEGKKVKVDPEQWSIINDRLFINYDEKIQRKWMENKFEYIGKADKKWEELFNKNNR